MQNNQFPQNIGKPQFQNGSINKNFQIPPNIIEQNPEFFNIPNPNIPNKQQQINPNNNIPQFPIKIQPQINPNNNHPPPILMNNIQNQQLNRNINQQIKIVCQACNQKDSEIAAANKKLKELTDENKKLQEEKQKEVISKEQITQQQKELQKEFNEEREELLEKLKNMENQMKKEIQGKDKQLREKEERIGDLECELKSEKQKQQNQYNLSGRDEQNQNEINYLKKTISELKQQNQECEKLKLQLNNQNEEVQLYKNQQEKVNRQLIEEQSNYQKSIKEIIDLKANIQDLQEQLQFEIQAKTSSYQQYKIKFDEQSILKKQLKELQEEIQVQKDQNKVLKSQIELFINQRPMAEQEIQQNQEQISQYNLIQQREREKQEEKANKLKKEQELKEQQRLIAQENQRKQDMDKQQKILYGKTLKQKMMESHGQLEVCFVIDITYSMDQYKNIVIQSIQETMKQIKLLTNRNTQFSTVCYQDFDEKGMLPNNLYQQHDFTKDPDQIKSFLSKIQCEGGNDEPEDVAGGLQQMCDQISWQKPFRVAILICDSPAHGKRFNGVRFFGGIIGNSGNYTDDYPEKGQDLIYAIQAMIKKEIILIALNLTKNTETMYKEIKKIYQESNRPDLFYFQNLSESSASNILQEMIKNIGQAAVLATQTNRRETKSKNDKPTVVKQNKNGAIEALCKVGNFFDFDKTKKIETIQQNFQIYSVCLNDESFLENICNLKRLKYPQDYIDKAEGTWNCIRTKSPFAFGMMKEVYLMKKANNTTQELYVIKTPLGGKTYESKEKAIEECRSHLISQSLMRMFMKDIRQACESKRIPIIYPTVIYTDFLILEENPNSFWIAERFFKGEFVKYNNNYGYISEDKSILNQIAQAFSYYTYFKSNFNYMINDVQGVGTYFTDPAINTIEGKFDETDMGQDGQGQYMVAYDKNKNICRHLIKEILEIDDD